MIIEKVARILDYFNKEKIVRIILMLFDVTYINPFLSSFYLEPEAKRSLLGVDVRYQCIEHLHQVVEQTLG